MITAIARLPANCKVRISYLEPVLAASDVDPRDFNDIFLASRMTVGSLRGFMLIYIPYGKWERVVNLNTPSASSATAKCFVT